MITRSTFTSILFSISIISTFSQVQNIRYGVKYIPGTSDYNCYFTVSSGFAESSEDRILNDAQFSIKVETGASISLVASNLPFLDNEFYNGTEPAVWSVSQSVISPASDPEFDYYSFEPDLSQTCRFNDLFQNTEYNLLRISVEGSCVKGVQIFKNGIDPGASGSGMGGKDFANTMRINSSSSLFLGLDAGIAFGADLILDDVFSCDGDCVTLEVGGNCDLSNYTYLWSDGSSGSSITICPDSTMEMSVLVEGTNGFSGQFTGSINYVEPFIVNSYNDFACIGSDLGFYLEDYIWRSGTWESNNPDVAFVNEEEGSFVTILKEGLVSFTFTDEETGCTAVSSDIQVLPELEIIPVDGTSLKVGETLSLDISELYGAGIYWNVYPANIARVYDGVLYGLRPGVCEVSFDLNLEFVCESESITIVVEDNVICNDEGIKIWNNVKIGDINTNYEIESSASSNKFFLNDIQDCIIVYDGNSGSMILHTLDVAGQIIEEVELFTNSNHDSEYDYEIELHDMDLDGLMDVILIGSKFSAENRLQVYRNLGDSSFELEIEESWCNSNINDDVIEVADFDNDGFLDIFFTCRNNIGYQVVFNDNWTPVSVYGSESVRYWIVPLDINNDGFLDLAFENLGILMNNGDRSFTFDSEYQISRGLCSSNSVGKKGRLRYETESNLLYGHNQIYTPIDVQTGTFGKCADLYFNVSVCDNLMREPRFKANINSLTEKDIVVVSSGIFMAVNPSIPCYGISNGFKHFNFGGVANKYKQIDIGNDGYTDFFYLEGNEIFASLNPNSSTEHIIKGNCYIDENDNGLYDTDEIPLRNVKIKTDQSSVVFLTDESGKFALLPPTNDYVLSASVTEGQWEENFMSLASADVLNGCSESNNFGFVQAPGLPISGNISISNSITRCDFETRFFITVENTGNEDAVFDLSFEFDDETTFMSSDIPNYTIANQELTASLGMLAPFSPETYLVTLKMPSGTSNLPMLSFGASVTSDAQELDEYSYMEQLRCSYDPNDKRVHPDRDGDDNLTLFDEELEYTIRFQNNGNDTAFAVRIVDPLDPNIDPSSISVISSSHLVETCIDQDTLIFLFEDIYLVDSMTNYGLSQGYVTYSCLAKAGIDENTIINNTADIIFDSNNPIITNTTTSTLVSMFCTDLEYNISIEICVGESINGHSDSGNYIDNYTDFNGCDSIVNLELQVSSYMTSNENLLICDGDAVLIGGALISEPTTVIDTLESSTGCIDSIRVLTVQFVDKKEVEIDVEICEGEDFVGLTVSGQYTFDLFSVLGCDSIVTVNLDVITPVSEDLVLSVCEGESVTIFDNEYQFIESTEFIDTVFNVNNCPVEYINVQVVVIDPIEASIDTSICDGEEFFGLLVSGNYIIDTIDQITGCPLIIDVDLEVLLASDPSCIVGTSEEQRFKIELFPNPASDQIVIKSDYNIESIEIFDTQLRKLLSMDTNATFAEISVRELNSGVYIIRCAMNNQDVYKILIVQ